MPIISDPVIVYDDQSSDTKRTEVAERGIFAFDWSYELKAYRLLAVPSTHLNIRSLDETHRDIFSGVKLDCSFNNRDISGNLEKIIKF